MARWLHQQTIIFSTAGTVTVENMGLGGVTVALSGLSSATATTDDNGQYAFTGLRMGSYSVEISGFDSDEIGFSNTASAVTVGVGESKIVSFDGTYLRTAGIQGRVSVEGEGLEGVTVSLSGGPDGVDETATTDAAGQYSFARLRAGDYQVGISGYDTDDYEFEVTSQNVTVALGETANVPFEGVLLRTSGISGRVSVEGMGLEGITVTLSMADADDMTGMTDAGGLYAFAGLAAGDYTVGIAVESDAYVFESMSMDVTVGDDETQIVNFEGMHARTASVSGMLFIDELMKNDMMDEGENALPHAGVPVVLVGPGVNDQVPSATDEMGQYSFTGLRAGGYQLVVPVTEPMGDFAFGGSATGYALSVGVGESVTQNLPIDITHTTVNFTATLKAGDDRGAAIPGASVTLYSDMDGDDMVGAGETDEMGMTAIRFAREGTSGNMVYASVGHDDYSGDGMTAVMWDPQLTMTQGTNDNDIVNLNVDVTVSGATVTTEYGGGDALAGWAIDVMMGDDAVEGDDVPDMLDGDGMAAFMATVDSAGALPVTYTFSVAGDQDDGMDGGESYEGTDVEYTHTGLALAGTMDAGTIEVSYTTQTLNVWVHHERDQAMGYTGNVVGGDVRMSGVLDLSIRYIDDAGRSRSFTGAQWNAGANTQFEEDNTLSNGAIIRGHGKAGLVVFSHLPAGNNVIVSASKADPTDNTIMVLDPDELATFRNMDDNGVMGGAFGDMGGFSHTVSVCPLMATDPTGQDYGECGSFAYVDTHNVLGQVWKNRVRTDPATDGFRFDGLYQVPGTMFGVDPVAGKSLAGESKSFTAASTNSRATSWDDRKEFRFGRLAAGAYALNVPDGWRATMGDPDHVGEERDALGAEINLNMDYQIDVTPATGVLFGKVTDSNGFAMDSATVTANNVSTMTDSKGRYILEGIEPVIGIDGRPTNPIYRNQRIIAVSVSMDKFDAEADTMMFAGTVNNATADTETHDVMLAGSANRIFITGRVTNILTGDGIGRVEVMVDGAAPLNRERRSWHPDFGKLLTAADGTYSAQVDTKARGQTADVSVAKDGYHFPVDESPVLADGNSPAVVNFQGYENGNITGTVQGPDGRALGGVTITATSTATGVTDAADEAMTNSVGQFSLNVPPVSTYRIDASLEGHIFDYPNNNQSVFAGPGQTVSYGRIMAKTAGALNVAAVRERADDDAATTDVDESEQRWGTTILVTFTADSTNVPDGYADAVFTFQTNTGTGGAWTDATGTPVNDTDGDPIAGRFTIPTPGATEGGDGEFMVRVVATANDDGTNTPALDALVINSEPATVAAVDPSASGVAARRQAADTDTEADATGNFIQASWSAVTNANSDFRVVALVESASFGSTWVVLQGTVAANDRAAVSADISSDLVTTVALPDGTGGAITVTEEELAAAIMIAVESVQGAADTTDDGPKWVRSTAVELDARSSS